MRKTIRDPQRTRQKILTHATKEFAARGYDGARVDSIAARCKLSKNMIYYYFASKEGLFVAVLEDMYARLRARQAEITFTAMEPVDAMRKLVGQTFRAFAEQPEAIRLLNDENLHKARHIKRSQQLRALYDPLIATLAKILEDGVRKGQFRASIDPRFLYISLSSLAYHYLSNQYTLQLALDMPLATAAAHERWAAHISDMVVSYCQPQGLSTMVDLAPRGNVLTLTARRSAKPS